jgi:hypothetical protein
LLQQLFRRWARRWQKPILLRHLLRLRLQLAAALLVLRIFRLLTFCSPPAAAVFSARPTLALHAQPMEWQLRHSGGIIVRQLLKEKTENFNAKFDYKTIFKEKYFLKSEMSPKMQECQRVSTYT